MPRRAAAPNTISPDDRDHQDEVVRRVTRILVDGAEDAARTIARAASGAEVDSQAVSAAVKLLDHALGKPVEKQQTDVTANRLASLLESIRNARTEA